MNKCHMTLKGRFFALSIVLTVSALSLNAFADGSGGATSGGGAMQKKKIGGGARTASQTSATPNPCPSDAQTMFTPHYGIKTHFDPANGCQGVQTPFCAPQTWVLSNGGCTAPVTSCTGNTYMADGACQDCTYFNGKSPANYPGVPKQCFGASAPSPSPSPSSGVGNSSSSNGSCTTYVYQNQMNGSWTMVTPPNQNYTRAQMQAMPFFTGGTGSPYPGSGSTVLSALDVRCDQYIPGSHVKAVTHVNQPQGTRNLEFYDTICETPSGVTLPDGSAAPCGVSSSSVASSTASSSSISGDHCTQMSATVYDPHIAGEPALRFPVGTSVCCGSMGSNGQPDFIMLNCMNRPYQNGYCVPVVYNGSSGHQCGAIGYVKPDGTFFRY